jgi:hypothetical protein
MMGCIRTIIGFVVALAIAGVLFLNRDRVTDAVNRLRGREAVVATVPSQELADAASARLDDLADGKTQRVALSELDVQSLLQYKYRSLLPAFVNAPVVELDGDKVEITARVPVDRLPQLNELGDAAAFLPDTADLGIRGSVLPLRPGRVALTVDQVRAQKIPLPQRLVAGALSRLGRKDEPGLPLDAMAVRLPPGADAAYVRADSLVFIGSSRN